MAYTNIKLKYSNFTIKDGYFYSFIHDNDIFYKKNTEGDVVFTYPLDTSLEGSEVLEVCYDGINFWTLQVGSSDTKCIIKKWRIENYICKLKDTYTFGDSSSYYQSSTVSIEAFSSSLANDLPFGSTFFTLPSTFKHSIPTGSLITIGPNAAGLYEEVTVTGTIYNNTYGLDFYTSTEHFEGESVAFVTNFWMFNAYKGTSVSPSLMRYSLANKEWDYILEDDSFDSTTGSIFYVDEVSNHKYLLYVYGTALRFFNIDTKEVEKAFTMDNIKTNGTTVIPIYGLEIENDTVYRLQKFTKYFETDYSLTTYNYQCSTLRSFVDSISMEIYPKILPSNGMSLAEVTTIIQDQYGDPAQYKVAHISDDDSTGSVTIEEPLTNLQGVATSYYRAGLSVRAVTVTALATQYD